MNYRYFFVEKLRRAQQWNEFEKSRFFFRFEWSEFFFSFWILLTMILMWFPCLSFNFFFYFENIILCDRMTDFGDFNFKKKFIPFFVKRICYNFIQVIWSYIFFQDATTSNLFLAWLLLMTLLKIVGFS